MLYSEEVSDQEDPRFAREDRGWEMIEHSLFRKEAGYKVFEELWVHRRTNRQQIVKRITGRNM